MNSIPRGAARLPEILALEFLLLAFWGILAIR